MRTFGEREKIEKESLAAFSSLSHLVAFSDLEFCTENNFVGINRGRLFIKHLFGYLLL